MQSLSVIISQFVLCAVAYKQKRVDLDLGASDGFCEPVSG